MTYSAVSEKMEGQMWVVIISKRVHNYSYDLI